MCFTASAPQAGARLALCSFLLMFMLLASGRSDAAAGSSSGVGPSVQEVVEFTRIIPQGGEDVVVSPDRRQAFVVVRMAEVARELNRYEVQLLDLRPERLASGRSAAPRTLLRFEARQDHDNGFPFLLDARWLDDAILAFRARLNDAPYQVYTLDVSRGELTQRTFEGGEFGVVSFEFSRDRNQIVYAVRIPNPPMAPGDRSLVVGNRSLWHVTAGREHVRLHRPLYQYAAMALGATGPGQRLGSPVRAIGTGMPTISVSPDGRWALIPRFEADRHLEWADRYPLVKTVADGYGGALAMDPAGYFVHPNQWLARRQVAYRLSDGAEQPVLDAPDDTAPGGNQRVDTLWQADGSSVILAGTHLPTTHALDPKMSTESHVVEYWPDSGRTSVIAALGGRLDRLVAAKDGQAFTLVLEGGRRRSFRRHATGWQEMTVSPAAPTTERPDERLLQKGWRLRVEQALDVPEDVVALGPDGQRVRLTAFHPIFDPATWGRMNPFHWTDRNGKRYAGGLMLPSDYDPARRYPVVIQTYGFDPRRFYLDGSNLAAGMTSGYPGRAILREGILVLALPHSVREPGEARTLAIRHGRAALMTQSAIDALVSRGIADPDRIGIIGWSVWSEYVLNMLTFHGLPIRAATLLDGDANTLWHHTLTTGHSDYTYRRFNATNAGLPFGDGLDNWVARDPSLHTDCIHAAVRIENYGPFVSTYWDIYGLLRRQYKAVEKILIPAGYHALGHPSERMISLQGNVDWYAFWLAGRERATPVLQNESDASLREQYARWRQMAEMKRADDAKPRCKPPAHVQG